MAGTSSTLLRPANVFRMTLIVLVLVAVFLFRDLWLPRGYDVSPAAPKIDHSQSEQSISTPEATDVPIFEHPALGDDSCKDAPGAERVLLMLKTGATELYLKLPVHFSTTLLCVPKYMIFSDLEQKFGEVQIYDTIAPVSDRWRNEHEDFELYRKLSDWRAEGQDVGQLMGDKGWNLDRWKFLPMLHMAYEAASEEIDWFVVMEADTSLSWTNLLLWLQTMNPKDAIYAGAQNMLGDTVFAHGGSGIVMSRGALEKLESTRDSAGHAEYDDKWEQKTGITCCGDAIVAEAFLEAGVPMTHSWPIIQGETVNTVDWSPHHWCTPPVTFHHVTSIEIDAVWKYERKWVEEHGWDTPYLYRDLFAKFVEPHINVTYDNWNNLSKDRKLLSADRASDQDPDFDSLEDWEQQAVMSKEACKEACMHLHDDECMQWMYSPGRCYLGRNIRYGKSDEKENEHWTSGWIQERLETYRNKMQDCSIRWSG